MSCPSRFSPSFLTVVSSFEPIHSRGAARSSMSPSSISGYSVSRNCADKAGAKHDAVAQTADALFLEKRLGQPGGKLQIFALLGDGFLAQRDDRGPVGEFPFDLPGALREFFVLAARLANLVVNRGAS